MGKHIDVYSQKGLTKIIKSFHSEHFELDVILYFKQHVESTGNAAEHLTAFINKNKAAA